jgi:hypothetical protein
MKSLYYRIYYTIYRGLIWIGQREETDMIRVNAFIIQSIFIMLFSVGLLGFLIALIGKSLIAHSKLQGIIFALSIIGINGYAIFYKNKYKEVENSLSVTWVKMKSKNILLTLAFMLFSIGFIVLSVVYVKAHTLHN